MDIEGSEPVMYGTLMKDYMYYQKGRVVSVVSVKRMWKATGDLCFRQKAFSYRVVYLLLLPKVIVFIDYYMGNIEIFKREILDKIEGLEPSLETAFLYHVHSLG